MFIKTVKVKTVATFRLITIQPGPKGDKICLSTSTAEFKTTSYYCLSYTWQPHGPIHEILVNDTPTTIGHNLWLFLRSARSAGLDTPIWIDALSIDQGNVAERNRIVSRMGDIYGNAGRVISWLGELNRSSTRFFAELKKMEGPLLALSQRRDRRAAISAKLESLNSHARSLWESNAIDALSLPYYERLWIAQEILLSDALYIWIDGADPLDMDIFSEIVITILSQRKQETLLPIPGYKYIWWHYATSQESRVIQGPIDLASLLPRFAESKCQMPLDRVYALLSLATNGSNFDVDYAIDLPTLFTRTMEFSMDGRAIDDLLLVGANLLELLQLLPPDPITKHTADFLDTSSWSTVSPPTYHMATLLTSDLTQLKLPVVAITVRESTNVHLFEYACDASADPPRITYCRAHEYLQGRPALPAKLGSAHDKAYYIYTPSPSEKVHYFIRNAHAPRLHSWNSSPPQWDKSSTAATKTTVTGDLSSSSLPPPHLSPSTRSVKLGIVWDAHFIRASSHVFTSAAQEVSSSTWRQLQPSQTASNALELRSGGRGGKVWRKPPAARATGLRVSRGDFVVRRMVCVRSDKGGGGGTRGESTKRNG